MTPPISPPPELVEGWIEMAKPEPWKRPPDPNVLCTLAAQWGYEQCHEEIMLHAMHSLAPAPCVEDDDND